MSACVKCGNVGNGHIWQSTQGFGSNPLHKTRFCRGASHGGCWMAPPDQPEREHLDKQCHACEYAWAEPCKDAKP